MTSLSSIQRPSPNAVHQMFRQKGALHALRPAQSAQAPELEQVSRRIATGTLDVRQVLLTTGLGLSRCEGLPVRLPSLLIPGLRMMEEFRRQTGQAPGYLVYQATDFIAEANGIPATIATQHAKSMETYLRGYVEKFHAEISDRVTFRMGNDDTPDTRTAIERISGDLLRAPALQDILTSLKRCQERRAPGSDSHVRYAAANALFNGADAQHYPYDDLAREQGICTVLPIGGYSEKLFFALTSAVAATQATRTVIPMLTSIGSRPTYYPYPDLHDPCSLAELADIRVKDAHILGDLQALSSTGATVQTLRDVYPSRS